MSVEALMSKGNEPLTLLREAGQSFSKMEVF